MLIGDFDVGKVVTKAINSLIKDKEQLGNQRLFL